VLDPLVESADELSFELSPVSAFATPALLTTTMPKPTATAIPATRETCLLWAAPCLAGGSGPTMVPPARDN
jgi:hypothetical protein